MKRHYKYELRETVPCLSWLMQVSVDKSEVLVKHGTAVECRDGFFVAGVWSGEFTKGEIDKAECSCCSGSCMSQMGGGIGMH